MAKMDEYFGGIEVGDILYSSCQAQNMYFLTFKKNNTGQWNYSI